MQDPQGFIEGFKDRYGEGKEDYRMARYTYNAEQGRDAEGARLYQTLATNPTFVLLKDLFRRKDDPALYEKKRQEMGMGLSKDTKTRTGQILGTLANDLTQDTSRGLWWLLNAPQAVGNVVNEVAINTANPDLFRHEAVKSKVLENGLNEVDRPIRAHNYSKGELVLPKGKKDPRYATWVDDMKKDHQRAIDAGIISPDGQLKKGVQKQYAKDMKGLIYTKRKFNPGDVAALGIPTGVAINAGIGLLNPLGGSGGYEAVLPSQEDPTKTSNVIGEVAAKYILGRTGNLAPYEEFVKHRPDVDVGEYNRYKAFKYDKQLDYDISDGNVNLVPGGVLKATTDGIHGPEVQFLGRSLPVTTTLIPYLGALAGGVAGVRSKRPIARGLQYGLGGLAAGSAVGLIAEEARRRASSNNNQMQGGNAEQYLGN
jgi:hypothetical protein